MVTLEWAAFFFVMIGTGITVVLCWREYATGLGLGGWELGLWDSVLSKGRANGFYLRWLGSQPSVYLW